MIPDMTLIEAGVFIDAEQFKDDSIVNLHLITALIYRPIIKEDGDEYIIEKHKAEGFEKRANLFKDRVSIEMVMGAVLFFFSSRDEIIRRYNNLFYTGESSDDLDEDDDNPNSYE